MQGITQKDMIAYMVYSSEKITEYTDKTIENYVRILMNNLKNVPIGQVLFQVDLRLFNYFNYHAILNNEEIINYAILIYKRLLNYFNREFSDKEIINESKIIFDKHSVRTAKEAVIAENLELSIN